MPHPEYQTVIGILLDAHFVLLPKRIASGRNTGGQLSNASHCLMAAIITRRATVTQIVDLFSDTKQRLAALKRQMTV